MTTPPDVTLLPIPYPYKAMLAICSDLDETPSAKTYFATIAYLNGRGETPFGQGLGLEVGNTMYFYMQPEEFSYWNASDADREKIRVLIRSGHVDTIHSFGDTADQRSQAGETLEHLDSHGCKIRVWVDHAIAPTNFGADIMQGQGDCVGSQAYHSDLTLQYGIRYVWRGRVSSVYGQDAPVSFSGIWCGHRPIESFDTLSREMVKYFMARLGHEKYEMHARNELARNIKLRDGRSTIEFFRANPNPGGISVGDNAAGLGDALSDRFLDRLVARSAKSIVYTHLGKKIDPQTGFPAVTRVALEKLADRQRKKEILVATTRRVLDYREMQKQISWHIIRDDKDWRIVIDRSGYQASLDGLSFRVPNTMNVEIFEGDQQQATLREEITGTQYSALSIGWNRLEYGLS